MALVSDVRVGKRRPAIELSDLVRRSRERLSKLPYVVRDAVESWLGRRSPIGGSALIEPGAFPWVAELEANWAAIRRELDAVMSLRAKLPAMGDISPVQYAIAEQPIWKVFFFQAYGERSERNRHLCPETARLLDRIPDLEVAFFSVLEPGAHLSAHRGSYKGLVRAHLGLIVPEPRSAVRMRVGHQFVHWEEGRCVVFDDTYHHEVWNDTDGVRVVLLIDVPRPFGPILNRINKAIIGAARLTPFVKTALTRYRAWEEAFYAADAEVRLPSRGE